MDSVATVDSSAGTSVYEKYNLVDRVHRSHQMTQHHQRQPALVFFRPTTDSLILISRYQQRHSHPTKTMLITLKPWAWLDKYLEQQCTRHASTQYHHYKAVADTNTSSKLVIDISSGSESSSDSESETSTRKCNETETRTSTVPGTGPGTGTEAIGCDDSD